MFFSHGRKICSFAKLLTYDFEQKLAFLTYYVFSFQIDKVLRLIKFFFGKFVSIFLVPFQLPLTPCNLLYPLVTSCSPLYPPRFPSYAPVTAWPKNLHFCKGVDLWFFLKNCLFWQTMFFFLILLNRLFDFVLHWKDRRLDFRMFFLHRRKFCIFAKGLTYDVS